MTILWKQNTKMLVMTTSCMSKQFGFGNNIFTLQNKNDMWGQHGLIRSPKITKVVGQKLVQIFN